MRPRSKGLLTATIWMTLVRSKRATRWRTPASEMPRSLAIAVNGRRPSTCRWPMMATSVLSSACLRMGLL